MPSTNVRNFNSDWRIRIPGLIRDVPCVRKNIIQINLTPPKYATSQATFKTAQQYLSGISIVDFGKLLDEDLIRTITTTKTSPLGTVRVVDGTIFQDVATGVTFTGYAFIELLHCYIRNKTRNVTPFKFETRTVDGVRYYTGFTV